MNWNNAISGIGAGLSGHPEDWKEDEDKNKTDSKEEPHLLSFFNKLALSGGCENITNKNFEQENNAMNRGNGASY